MPKINIQDYETIYALLVLLFVLPISAISQEKLEGIDEIGSFAEGLAAVRKGNQWGFINEKGELAINFRDDVVWNKMHNLVIVKLRASDIRHFKKVCVWFKK